MLLSVPIGKSPGCIGTNLSVEKHLRPTLGKLLLGGAAAALPALLNSKIGKLSPSSLNHLRAYCHRLHAVASMRSVGWWMGSNPVNRLELPKFKEPRRKRATVAAEDVPRVLSALTPEWRPLFATACRTFASSTSSAFDARTSFAFLRFGCCCQRCRCGLDEEEEAIGSRRK